MKNLKLIALGLTLLAQISLFSAMKEPKSEKAKKYEQAVIDTKILIADLIPIVLGYVNFEQQVQEANYKLAKAIRDDELNKAEEAIKLGADVNAIIDILQGSPLNYIIENKKGKNALDFLNLLLSNGVDVNGMQYSRTPLMKAAFFGNYDLVKALLDYMVKTNQTNSENEKMAYDYAENAYNTRVLGDKDKADIGILENYLKIMQLLSPEAAEERLIDRRIMIELDKEKQQELIAKAKRMEREDLEKLKQFIKNENARKLQIAKENEQIAKERKQKAEEALNQLANQPTEEEEEEESWEDQETGWEESEFQDE